MNAIAFPIPEEIQALADAVERFLKSEVSRAMRGPGVAQG